MANLKVKVTSIFSIYFKILTFYLVQNSMAELISTLEDISVRIPKTILQWHSFSLIFGHKPNNANLNNILNAIEALQSQQACSLTPIPILNPFMFLEKSSNHSKNSLTNSKSQFIFYGNSDEFRLLISKTFNPFRHSWYIMEINEDIFPWLDVFKDLALTIESEVFLSSTGFNLLRVYEFYKICSYCPIQTILICSVNQNGTLIGDNCLTDKLQRRRNLMRSQLNVVAVDVLPFMSNVTFDSNGLAQVNGGLFGAIFAIIADQLNLTYSINILNGYRYGAFRNGSWNGMIGYLSRSEADMTISELSMAEDRVGFIDYSVAFESVGRKLYIKKVIQTKNINWKFYSSPFSPYLHFSVIFWIGSMSVLLWLAGLHRKDKAYETISFKESSWIAFSTILQKGAHMIPVGPIAKMIFIIFSFTFLIIFCAYSATLISQLSSSPPITIPFRNLQEFLKKARDWKAGPIKGDLTQIYMEKTCPELLKKGENSQCDLLVSLWKNVIQPDKDNLPLTFKDGFDRLRSGKFAFLTTSVGARDLILNQLEERDACSILEMNGDYLSSNLAFGLRKNFSYKSLINYKILQLQKSGVLKRLKRSWLPQQKQCLDPQSSKFKDATIYDVGVAPLIWLMGLLLSFFLFCFEYVVLGRRSHY